MRCNMTGLGSWAGISCCWRLSGRAALNWYCLCIFLDCVLFMFAFGPAPLTHCPCYYLQYNCRARGICFHQTLINLVSDYVLHGEITLRDSPHNRVVIYSSMMINSPNKHLPSGLCSDDCGHATQSMPLHLCPQSGGINWIILWLHTWNRPKRFERK